MASKKLASMVTLVTGGASGLGKAVCEKLITDGSRVLICDLPSSNGLDLAKQLGDNTHFVPADIRDEKNIQTVLSETKDKFGKLDNVVNCAGIAIAFQTYNFNRKTSHRLEDFEKILSVNTIGTFNVIRLAAGLIGENVPDENGQRGVIINTSSMAAFDGQLGQAAYAASSAAIAGMTLPIARDFASHGIRIVTVAPGLFDTPILSFLPEKVIKFLSQATPFPQRLGKPEEFAQMISSIIENPMLNGEVIRLDGGLRLSL